MPSADQPFAFYVQLNANDDLTGHKICQNLLPF